MLYHILRILLEVLCFSFLFSSPISMNASDGSDFGSFITFGNWLIHCNSLRMDPWLGGLEGQSRFVRGKG